jgi:hypothetical protein
MSDWKKDLDKKEKELNLTKGGNDGQIISSTRISDRNNSRSNSDVHRVSVHKEINNVKEKEEKVMITKDAALDDLEKIDVIALSTNKVIVEVGKVIVKILATIRSNQLLTDEEKIKIREARKARDARKPETK